MLGGVVLFEVVADRWGFNYVVVCFLGVCFIYLVCLCCGVGFVVRVEWVELWE